MTVLVTGSSGFIGQWIGNVLKANGQRFAGLGRSGDQGESFYQCDILDGAALKRVFDAVQPESVIHLAARTDTNEKKDLSGYKCNTDGVRNVLQCIQNTPSVQRVIITSSQRVCKIGYVPQDENDYCPDTLYGKSKVLTEQITRELDGGKKEWCIVRPTAVWGPGMNKHRQKLLMSIHRGTFFHCGQGPLYKSEGYVENVAFQYWKLLSAPCHDIYRRVFYLGDYQPLSLRDYADELACVMKAPSIPTMPLSMARMLALMGDALNAMGVEHFPFNGSCLNDILTEYRFDMSKTKKVCGNLPFSFKEGVKNTVEWYSQISRQIN